MNSYKEHLQMIQYYTHTSDLLCSWACLAVMVACAVCAAFRWFHMCHPYDENPAHFYPARKIVTVAFLGQVLNAPFLLRPSLPASVSYAASVELFLCSAFLMLIFNAFFHRPLPHKRVAMAVLVWAPLAFAAASGIGLTAAPATFAPLIMRWNPIVISTCAFLIGLKIFKDMLWFVRKIDRYHKAEFSNEDDFPYVFAQKLIWQPWVVLILCWLAMLLCSVGLLVALWLFLAVVLVYYTIIIMRPQIGTLASEIEGEEDEEILSKNAAEGTQDEAAVGSIDETELAREAIRLRVIEIARSRYLEPHLTRRDIVGMFDFGERTIAGEIISSYGFYDMINALRLHHARLYQAAHPNETKESAAIRFGFKDRFAMRHAERRITLQHPEILEDFTPSGVT